MNCHFLVLVIAGLLICNGSNAKVSLSKKLHDAVHQIAARYGMTNAEALRLVRLDDPKTQILNDLNDLLTALRGEQNQADADHEVFASQKSAERQGLTSSLEQLNSVLDQDESDLAQIQGEIADAQKLAEKKQAEASDADSQVKLYQSFLDQLKNTRAENKAKFDDIIKQHDDSISTLDVLIDMVSKFQFNDALMKLMSQRHSFLHRKSASLVSFVKAAIELVKKGKDKNDPSRNQIRDKLLALLNKIKQGTQDSRDLYVQAEQEEINEYSEQVSQYSSMIQSSQQRRDEAQVVVDQQNGLIPQLQVQATDKQSSIDSDEKLIQQTENAIAALDEQVSQENSEYQGITQTRIQDMNDVNAAIEYVNTHVDGMTVKGLCHIGAPNCYRCLTKDHCSDNQFCSEDGQCQDVPQPVLIGGTVPEHVTLGIECPFAKTIVSIQFASYGMPDGDFPNYSYGWCHSGSTLPIVSNMCVGQTACSIPADNGVFGDPCYGTFKHMDIVAVCQ